MDRNIKILSISFALIFIGYNGVQQFVTTYFESLGNVGIGFNMLVVVYFVFMTVSLFSYIFVRRFGVKHCMLFSAAFYIAFMLSLLSKNVIVLYSTSILLGVAAAVLWTSQNIYLIEKSSKHGTSSGFFITFLNLGSGIGIMLFGYLVTQYSFDLSFVLFTIITILGMLLLTRIRDVRSIIETTKNKPDIKMIKNVLLSPMAIKISLISFSCMFIVGLSIGAIPLKINGILGISFVGLILSMFYLVPILISYVSGRLSDIYGRKIFIAISYVLAVIGLVVLYLSTEFVTLFFGVLLLVLNYSLLRPIVMALPGDFKNKNNLAVLTSVLWAFGNLGILCALLISAIFPLEIVWIASAIIVAISFVLITPVLRRDTKTVAKMIAEEIEK